MRIPRRAITSLAVVGVLAGGLVFPGAPAVAAGPPEAPVSEAATGITPTTATLKGTLNPKTNATAGWYFAYSPEGGCVGFVNTTPRGGEVTGEAIKISTQLTALLPNTEYTFCLVATNAEGEEAFGEPLTFTTPAVKPAVDGESVSGVTASAAKLEAQVNPENQETTCAFEYGKSEAYGTSVACEPPVLGVEAIGDQLVSSRAAGLGPNETYHYRVVVENATGVTHGGDKTFTTPGRPLVTTGEAQGATRTTVRLSGSVDPEGGETFYSFVYIDQAGYEAAIAESAPDPYARGGNTVYASLAASRKAGVVGPVTASELRAGATYHYALLATNVAGSTIGHDGTFTTASPTPPSAVTGAAGEITQTSAVVAGTVETRGLPTSYGFELGTEAGSYVPLASAAAGPPPGAQTVSLQLSYLVPGLTYHYRLCAQNHDGMTCGADQTFTTPGVPSPLASPASPPLLATTAITKESSNGVKALGTPTNKPLTNAQKLSKALKACAKKPQNRRASCEQQARKKYGKANRGRHGVKGKK
jgi:hypothetical protein